MGKGERKYLHYTAFGIVLFVAFILQYSFPMIKIFGISPLPVIPVFVCAAMIDGDLAGSMFGLFAGILCDTNSAYGACYHAILYLITGLVCGLLITHLMQNNLISAIVLNFGAITFNLLFNWMVSVVFIGRGNPFPMLVTDLLPMLAYTMVLSIPIYLLMNYGMSKRKKD